MRISRRTSGGRGEYEISEPTADGVTPHDLVDHRLVLDLGHGLTLDTATILLHAQGKFRIRRIDRNTDMQLHRQLVAALLLPDAVRANETLGGGGLVIQRGRYAVETIQITDVRREGDRATLRVEEVVIANRDHAADELYFDARMAALVKLWQGRAQLPVEVQQLVSRHEEMVRGGGPLHREAEQLVARLQTLLSDQSNDLGIVYSEYTDSLPPLLELLEIPMAEPSVRVEEIEPEQVELRRRTIREWKRWASHRGTASARFRALVRAAYDATCLVCGKRYPSTAHNRVPGVDAAHILPWADYVLDRVDNGVCLCKLCHWAFDEAIILITHEIDGYMVEVSPSARQIIQATRPDFSLEVFEALAGAIPEDRLPRAVADRPNPQFLTALQQVLEE